jgi:hypothetical protein
VGARFQNDFGARGGVNPHGDFVAHGSGGHEKCGFFAQHLGGKFLEAVYGWVLAEDVVADLGFVHGAAHLRRWFGDGITSEVNRFWHFYATSGFSLGRWGDTAAEQGDIFFVLLNLGVYAVDVPSKHLTHGGGDFAHAIEAVARAKPQSGSAQHDV